VKKIKTHCCSSLRKEARTFLCSSHENSTELVKRVERKFTLDGITKTSVILLEGNEMRHSLDVSLCIWYNNSVE